MGENATRAASQQSPHAESVAAQDAAPVRDCPDSAASSTLVPTSELSSFLQEACLEQVFENAPEAISIQQGSTTLVGRINQEFIRLFQFSPAEAVGNSIQSLIVPPDRYAETTWVAESVRAGKRLSLETRRRRKDGTLVDVLLSVAPILVNGEQVATYASYRDITDKKKTEDLNAALYAIAARNQTTEDLQQFYTAIHNIVAQLMSARNFYIAVYDPETQLLNFPYFVDEEDTCPEPK